MKVHLGFALLAIGGFAGSRFVAFGQPGSPAESGGESRGLQHVRSDSFAAPTAARGQSPLAAPSESVRLGLGVAIAPLKPVFAEMETLEFAWTFSSRSREGWLYSKILDGMVADPHDFATSGELLFENTDTRQTWRVECTAEILRKAKPRLVLRIQPGKSETAVLQVPDAGKHLVFVPCSGGDGADHLPPGRYQAVFTLHFVQPEDVPAGAENLWWRGLVTAPPVPFTIAPRPK